MVEECPRLDPPPLHWLAGVVFVAAVEAVSLGEWGEEASRPPLPQRVGCRAALTAHGVGGPRAEAARSLQSQGEWEGREGQRREPPARAPHGVTRRVP